MRIVCGCIKQHWRKLEAVYLRREPIADCDRGMKHVCWVATSYLSGDVTFGGAQRSRTGSSNVVEVLWGPDWDLPDSLCQDFI